MNTFIETPRLVIHPPQLSDFDNLYALQSDLDVMQYVGNGARSQEEVMIGLKKAIAHQEKHGFSLGSVHEKDNGRFIGRAGLIYLGYDDTQSDIEVAYALMKSAWGKGYGTELAKTLIKWGFECLPVNKLVAVVNPQNEASKHVLEKANMSYLGPTEYGNKEVAFYEINNGQANT